MLTSAQLRDVFPLSSALLTTEGFRMRANNSELPATAADPTSRPQDRATAQAWSEEVQARVLEWDGWLMANPHRQPRNDFGT